MPLHMQQAVQVTLVTPGHPAQEASWERIFDTVYTLLCDLYY